MLYNKSRILIAALVLLSALFVGSCDSLLETEPQQSISPEVGSSNAATIRAVATTTYSNLRSSNMYGQSYILAPDALADHMQNQRNSGRYLGTSANEIGAGVGGYGAAYNLIANANFVISALPDIPTADMPESEKERLEGEMLFLRALSFHNLARVYSYEPGQILDGFDHGIILRTEAVTGSDDADLRPRSTVGEVYTQIKDDLNDAIDLLSSSGDTDPFYANVGAAQALLARVHLYAGEYPQAITAATDAMDSGIADLATEGEVSTMWEEDANDSPNPESFFEIPIDDATESLGVNTAINSITTPAQWYDLVPSVELMDLFDPADERLSAWFATDPEGSANAGVYSVKYNGSAGEYTDYIPVIRYSDVLLIRAEAYARDDQDGLAVDDLTTLREERGLGPAPALVDQALIDEIMAERSRELHFEGHRWFDLKRNGLDIPKPADSGIPEIEYDDIRLLDDLPDDEVDLNPNFVQNPGY